MPKTLRTVVICVIAEILNFIVPAIFYHGLKIPLFFDTIFTVAVVFYCGLLPALCVSIGYNLINSFIWICHKGVFYLRLYCLRHFDCLFHLALCPQKG